MSPFGCLAMPDTPPQYYMPHNWYQALDTPSSTICVATTNKHCAITNHRISGIITKAGTHPYIVYINIVSEIMPVLLAAVALAAVRAAVLLTGAPTYHAVVAVSPLPPPASALADIA